MQDQQIYSTKEISMATGFCISTLTDWTLKGYIVPCESSARDMRFYTAQEKDRILEAKKVAESSGISVVIPLNRTLHEANTLHLNTVEDIMESSGRCRLTVINAIARVTGKQPYKTWVVKDADLEKVQAEMEKVRHNGGRPRKAEPTGTVKVHLKGIAIELSREDANALAEEIISQL